MLMIDFAGILLFCILLHLLAHKKKVSSGLVGPSDMGCSLEKLVFHQPCLVIWCVVIEMDSEIMA